MWSIMLYILSRPHAFKKNAFYNYFMGVIYKSLGQGS